VVCFINLYAVQSEWPHRLTSESLPDLREDLRDLSSQETLLDWLRNAVSILVCVHFLSLWILL
jgi:hypothetical protein